MTSSNPKSQNEGMFQIIRNLKSECPLGFRSPTSEELKFHIRADQELMKAIVIESIQRTPIKAEEDLNSSAIIDIDYLI